MGVSQCLCLYLTMGSSAPDGPAFTTRVDNWDCLVHHPELELADCGGYALLVVPSW